MLLDSIYDAILLTDAAGIVKCVNLRAEESFGASASELVGLDISSLFALDPAETRRRGARALSDNGFITIETRCIRRNGSGFQGELAIGKINDSDRQVAGDACLCYTVRDVSVRHKAQQDLKHALERMEALGRARMEFVSNVSHELRTPLTSMIYAVRNMQSGRAGTLSERASQYLVRLEADCRRMLGTVNDILDLRQIENNTLTLAKRHIAPVPIAREAAESLRVQAAAKGVEISVDEAPQIDFCIGDPAKLERVFINIIGNAIKFTPAGGSISVTAGRIPSYPGMTAVRVADTGVGIPPEALPRVTARYFQVGNQPVGTGLGLAISKELLELHGGKLLMESPVPNTGCGTLATVLLPIADGPAILVVASAANTCASALEAAFKTRGIAARRFTSGHAAFRECAEHSPDVVAVCGDTDDLTALDFSMRLRNDRRMRLLPLVFFSDGSPASEGAAHLLESLKVSTIGASASPRSSVGVIIKAIGK